ncbi:MAG: DUF4962 domain-containing protein [candidate division WOR-3 bacterium]
MKRRSVIICAAIMAVAAYADWEQLPNVPYGVPVGAGAAITYSYDQWGERPYDTVWGIFPDPQLEITYFLYYDCVEGAWHLPNEPAVNYLVNTAITFQWMEGGVLYVIGYDCGQHKDMLYWYDLKEELWDDEPIIDFSLGPRPGLAFRANPTYNREMQPIPGWLYCLAGGSKQFWRYWIPTSLEPVAVDGIYPGNGALIADQTPLFIWQEEPDATEYRLNVATDSGFGTIVIEVITTTPRYQVETKMANGEYYWKTAYRPSHGDWTWSPVHSFTLQGSWEKLEDIPEAVGEGAALAYPGNSFGIGDCLIAFVGGGDTDWYVYSIQEDRWLDRFGPATPNPQNIGSGLAAHRFFAFDHGTPWAIFGENSNVVSCYEWGSWLPWGDDPPEPLGPGASIASGKYFSKPFYHYIYLIVGEEPQNGTPRNHFWRLAVSAIDEKQEHNQVSGSQAKGSSSARTHLRFGADGVVEYLLEVPANVKVAVYDALGRQVAILYSGNQTAGVHRLKWTPQTSGAYFILFDTGKEQAKLKVVVR